MPSLSCSSFSSLPPSRDRREDLQGLLDEEGQGLQGLVTIEWEMPDLRSPLHTFHHKNNAVSIVWLCTFTSR
jgi:hypothetical protein